MLVLNLWLNLIKILNTEDQHSFQNGKLKIKLKLIELIYINILKIDKYLSHLNIFSEAWNNIIFFNIVRNLLPESKNLNQLLN